MAAVFFSHPDESNAVDKISATNVDRNVIFMRLARIEQHGNLRDGRDSPRGRTPRAGKPRGRRKSREGSGSEAGAKEPMTGKIMSQRDKPPGHLKQRCGFRLGRKPSGWVGFIDSVRYGRRYHARGGVCVPLRINKISDMANRSSPMGQMIRATSSAKNEISGVRIGCGRSAMKSAK